MPGCTTAFVLGHRRAEAHRFLTNYERIFTSHSDGKNWPRRMDTRRTASKYHQALLAPAKKESMQIIAGSVDIPENG